MPHSELHKKRFKKNLGVMAIVMGLCVLLWAITIIKMSG
jgi:hypothetical protein